MRSLFDDFERTDPSPAAAQEDSFSFLNRVGQPYWAEVRGLLDEWFNHFPQSGRHDLRQRFRSRRPGQHWGAWWELYLHELFVSLGFEVALHPQMPGSSKTPDFKIDRGGFKCFVEAAALFSGIVADDSELAPGWLLDAVNLIDDDRFFLLVKTVKGQSPNRLKNKQVVRPLTQWLDLLDPEEVQDAGDNFPTFVIAEDGWRIVFEAVPVTRRPAGRSDHRVLGGGPPIVGPVNDVDQLLDKLKTKSGRYGSLGAPAITAVLCLSAFMEDIDIERALYGRLAVVVAPNEHPGKTIRKRDGFWMHESGPQNRRVSAVLTGVQVHPWTVARSAPHLWLNPWADIAFPWAELPFSATTSSDTGATSLIRTAPSAPMHEIFGLPSDWPHGPAFP